KEMKQQHPYLYWDYGHCRDRYDQAVRLGRWKGIREGRGDPIQLYDLRTDPGEKHDLANQRPEIVQKIDTIMEEAVIPSDRYPIGEVYEGEPIWQKN
ncbi:MAG TPA: N-acetylgalactosamine 6-sulfate sulfatase, partial [bacterium]|nr:N-acetylgalactosamine 6-sulfate sulfatase [bacterium]